MGTATGFWAHPSPRSAWASCHTGLVEQTEQGVGTPCAAWRIPGCGEGRLPRPWPGPCHRAHTVAPSNLEISAAVGCQFSAGTGLEGRVGSRGEECLSWAGLRGEAVCT